MLVGAGRGVRLGLGVPKAFAPLGGRALFYHALERFHGLPEVNAVVLVLPGARARTFRPRLMKRYPKLAGVVAGGRRRRDSVAAGIRALPPGDVVLVHDIARPFASAALIRPVIAAARRSGGCVPGLRPVDTVKTVRGGRVTGTLDRDSLAAVQTPQGFRRSWCEGMYARRGGAPDDAALAEACGRDVIVVRGEKSNLKITGPEDLALAEAMVARSPGARAKGGAR